jgi:hydrogenase nickel incorporation protein HypA/HybF
MHEISIAESIRDIAEDYASREQLRSFRAIDLEIGALSGIEVDALTFAMEVVFRNSVLDGAEVRITHVAGEARCSNCGHCFAVEDAFTPCPECADTRADILRGEELRVLSLHVEE